MLIYNYDHRTGVFLGSSRADPDPLVPGEHLVPAHATAVAPPKTAAEFCACYQDGRWAAVPDHRGRIYWTPTGDRVEITDPGVRVPEDALSEPPDMRTLDEIKTDAIALLESEHAKRLAHLTGRATPEERDTWAAKGAAAEALLADAATATQRAMLEREATRTGETLAALAARVCAKSRAYHDLIGTSSGLRRAAINAVGNATNASSVNNILLAAEGDAVAEVAAWQKRNS